MQIGCQQFCIDPPFPVNRMLREEKHQAVSGHLYCRIAALYPENDLPFYHVSIDTVELWQSREYKPQNRYCTKRPYTLGQQEQTRS